MYVVLSPDQRFFYWWIFAKCRPEKHGFDLYKGFFMEKKNGPNSPDFENKDSKIARLYDNFWKVAKNIEGTFLSFLPSDCVCNRKLPTLFYG